MKVTINKLKKIIFDLSGKKFSTNRKDHVFKARIMPDYRCDIKFINRERSYSICRGISALDGADNPRAYNNRILGS